jgi:ribosomal protein L34
VANRTRLESDVELINALLDRIDRFQASRPAALATLHEDSVQTMLEGLLRPLTFEPQVSAAAVLSETALLSADGIGVRALVSEFLARMADAEEEKEWFRQMSREVQSRVAGYLTRATDGGRGILVERAARLGPSILVELRSDEDVMRHVTLRGAAGELYLRELTSLAGLLDSLNAQIEGNVAP